LQEVLFLHDANQPTSFTPASTDKQPRFSELTSDQQSFYRHLHDAFSTIVTTIFGKSRP
jgi:hypothetical protein